MPDAGESLGPYVIESLISQGGMGAVYRARNRVTGQLRALKVVLPQLAKNPDFVDRFVREATIASEVRHKNLVECFEPGIDGATVYLPMELLDGETLAARLRRVRQFSPREVASVLVPVTEAVQLLHDRGIIHRDLKPMNVFLAKTASGAEVPKVIDLGTARTLDDDEHTRTGMMIGSPYYMAIEQAEGRRDIDARVDQYALATIAYQMVTGLRPYESDDMRSALAKLLRGDPYELPGALVPGLSPAVEQVIVRGLSRDRDARFPSVSAFGAALDAAVAQVPDVVLPSTVMLASPLADAPTSVSGPTRVPVEPARARRTGPILAVGAAVVLLGVAVTAWALHVVASRDATVAAPLPAQPIAAPLPPPAEPLAAAPAPTIVASPAPPSVARPVPDAPGPAAAPDVVAQAPAGVATPPAEVHAPADVAAASGRARARARGRSAPGDGPRTGAPAPQCGARTGIPCL